MIKSIQRDKPKKTKKTENINENHINIDINMADKEKEHIREVIQEVMPLIIQPVDIDEEETKDDLEMDNLVSELESTIKNFMNFREQLTKKNINVPDNLLEMPDININEKNDIIKLIQILKDRIEQFKLLLLKPQQEQQQAQILSRKMRPTMSSIPPILRGNLDIPQPQRSRIRPIQYRNSNNDDARREFRETIDFLNNRNVFNTDDINLIDRGLLRLNRNNNYISNILNDPSNSQGENNLLRELLKSVQENIDLLMNRKNILQNTGPQNIPAEVEPLVPESGEFQEEPVIPLTPAPLIPQTGEPEFEEAVIKLKAPQRSTRTLDEYIRDMQKYLADNRGRLTEQARKRNYDRLEKALQEKSLQEQEDLATITDEDEEDDISDPLIMQINRRIDNRLKIINNYLNNIVSTGRSEAAVAQIRRNIETYRNNINDFRNNSSTTNEDLYNWLDQNLIMDNTNGDWATATAFISFIDNDMKNSDKNIKQGDIITLREIDITDILTDNPKARKAYGLYKNGQRIFSKNFPENTTQNEFASRFNSDGDIYSELDLLGVESTPETPPETQPEDEIIPPDPVYEISSSEERKNELATLRNNLYYTGRTGQEQIINELDNEIGNAINDNDAVILLDRVDIPVGIAYRNLPVKRINESDINSAELVNNLQTSDNPNARPSYLLYINNELQRGKFNNDAVLFNEYGDLYMPEDQEGKTINITFPFRSSSRQDLSVSEQPISNLTLREILDNRKQALQNWAIPEQDEDYRNELMSIIDFALYTLQDTDTIENSYVPVLSNADFDLSASLAYLKAYNESFNIEPISEDLKIKIEPSNLEGIYFLNVNNKRLSKEGDFMLLSTGFGEQIKIRDMKIQGVRSANPNGFQAGDSFSSGHIANLQGGLSGGANPAIYSVEAVINNAPLIQDIYKKLFGN